MAGIDPSEQKAAFVSLQNTMRQYQAGFDGFIHNQQDSLKSFLKEANKEHFQSVEYSAEKSFKSAEKFSKDIVKLAKKSSTEFHKHMKEILHGVSEHAKPIHEEHEKHSKKSVEGLEKLKETIKSFSVKELVGGFGEIATELGPAVGWGYVLKTILDHWTNRDLRFWE